MDSESDFSFMAALLPPPFHTTLWRGSPAWGHRVEFAGFEDTPMICVGEVADPFGWSADYDWSVETWIYFRTRRQYRAARRLARILVNERAFAFPSKRYVAHAEVLAYKPPGAEILVCGGREFETKWREQPSI